MWLSSWVKMGQSQSSGSGPEHSKKDDTRTRKRNINLLYQLEWGERRRKQRDQASKGTNPADTLILDFSPPELGETKFLLFIISALLWQMLPAYCHWWHLTLSAVEITEVRIKYYLLMEEEFIRTQEQMKHLEEKQEEENLRGTPMLVEALEEITDDNHAIVSTSMGSEQYISFFHL